MVDDELSKPPCLSLVVLLLLCDPSCELFQELLIHLVQEKVVELHTLGEVLVEPGEERLYLFIVALGHGHI